jgi:hypothetical protein
LTQCSQLSAVIQRPGMRTIVVMFIVRTHRSAQGFRRETQV